MDIEATDFVATGGKVMERITYRVGEVPCVFSVPMDKVRMVEVRRFDPAIVIRAGGTKKV